MHGRQLAAVVLLALGGVVTACSDDGTTAAVDENEVAAAPTTEARAVLSGLGGSDTSGIVRFGDTDSDAVEVRVELDGAPPGASEVILLPGGDCPSEGASVAGHGVTTVAVGTDGHASTVLTSEELSLTRGKGEFVRGRPLVIMADEAPVACGMVVAIGRWSES